jgi:hypothetical protein
MAAMRQTILVLCCALFSVAGCGDDTTAAKGGDMSVVVGDLSVGADLAVRKPDGVACGSMTCAVGENCCVATSNNTVSGETCIAASASCAGSTLECDGPEDCGTNPYCCATLNLAAASVDGGLPSLAGGDASCKGTCGFTVSTDLTTINTRLCHQDVDCAGLTLPFVGTALTCCSSTMATGLHFCAAAIGPITCP